MLKIILFVLSIVLGWNAIQVAAEVAANLHSPEVLALEIVEDLRVALAQFESIEEELSADE